MPDFLGSESAIALQKRIRDRNPVIAKSPDLVNGGRVMHFLDPAQTGWDQVRRYAEEDRAVGFVGVTLEPTLTNIRSNLGPDWETPYWLAMTGTRNKILPACETIRAAISLPDGWRISAHQEPDDSLISEIQSLNQVTGVSPYPAYYMRSEPFPVLTMCLHDKTGTLVATASVADRYHAESRLSGWVFDGMVSVSEDHRGKGLGKLVNALALLESAERFQWHVASEQVAPDNVPSKAMIEACGLTHEDGLYTIAAIKPGVTLTR